MQNVNQATAIQKFLNQSGWGKADRAALAGDASSRRYERVNIGSSAAMLMIAPPATAPELEQFIRIGAYLNDIGLSAPKIMAKDTENGLVLLEDLGDDLFAKIVPGNPEFEAETYCAAMEVLAHVHRSTVLVDVPVYDVTLMLEKARLASEWYAGCQGSTPKYVARLQPHLERIMAKPKVVALRDYHAENLIWLPDRNGLQRVGLLDFQDAMMAPAAYDVCSLLYDARRCVSPMVTDRAIETYLTAIGRDADEFAYEMAVCSAQRNLRILGVFVRLALSMGKTAYLDFIPRVWGHLNTALNHPELADLKAAVRAEIPEPNAARLISIRTRSQ